MSISAHQAWSCAQVAALDLPAVLRFVHRAGLGQFPEEQSGRDLPEPQAGPLVRGTHPDARLERLRRRADPGPGLSEIANQVVGYRPEHEDHGLRLRPLRRVGHAGGDVEGQPAQPGDPARALAAERDADRRLAGQGLGDGERLADPQAEPQAAVVEPGAEGQIYRPHHRGRPPEHVDPELVLGRHLGGRALAEPVTSPPRPEPLPDGRPPHGRRCRRDGHPEPGQHHPKGRHPLVEPAGAHELFGRPLPAEEGVRPGQMVGRGGEGVGRLPPAAVSGQCTGQF
jgi:hypothetical protein